MSFFYAVEDAEVVEGVGVSQGGAARICCDAFGPYELRAPHLPMLQQQQQQREDPREMERDRWIPQIDPTGKIHCSV